MEGNTFSRVTWFSHDALFMLPLKQQLSSLACMLRFVSTMTISHTFFCLFEMILTTWRSTTTQPCPRMSSSWSLLVECLFIRSMFVQGHDWLQGPAPTLPNCTKSTNPPHSLAEDVDWTQSCRVSGFSTVTWFFLPLFFYVVCLRGKSVYRDDQIHIVKSFVLWRLGWSKNSNDLKFFCKGYLFNLILWNFSCGI